MTSKLTRERIELIANFHRAMILPPSHDEIEELARMALAAMGSEPVGTFRKSAVGYTPSHHEDAVPLYAAPQLSPERDQVRREHADWSQATFGNVGPVGPLKHLSKEALEAAAEPDDLSEWADMQFLLWDAQRRAGITDEQITLAMIEKLAVNKQREWPEPKDGEPRLHIKEQPTPVVPDIDELRLAFEAAERESDDGFNLHKYGIGYADDETQGRWDTWLACRSAMLQGRQKSAGASNNGRIGENVQVMQDVSRCSTKAAPALDSPPKTAESRSGNSPVIPAGYVMVPKEPTAEMIWAAKYCFTSTPGWDVFKSAYIAMLAAAPQEVR